MVQINLTENNEIIVPTDGQPQFTNKKLRDVLNVKNDIQYKYYENC